MILHTHPMVLLPLPLLPLATDDSVQVTFCWLRCLLIFCLFCSLPLASLSNGVHMNE
jgi:hypothetical protein